MLPIRREKHYEIVLRRIGQLVEEQNLDVGDRLPPERDMAKALGVSRSSIREACSILELYNLIDNRTGGGKTLLSTSFDWVRELLAQKDVRDTETFEQFFEARIALEMAAAGSAATRATPSDLEEMGSALARMQEKVSANQGYENEDVSFHNAVVAAAHNPVISRVVAFVSGPCREQMRAEGLFVPDGPDDMKTMLLQHQEIYGNIIARNSEGAAEAMRVHLNTIYDMVM